MGKINDNYYLINGTLSNMKALVYPYGKLYYKNVRDISDIDIATIDLGTELPDVLAETNPNIQLTSKNYIVKFPYAKGIKVFKPIEQFVLTSKSIKLVDSFRDIAEERNHKYYHDKPLSDENNPKVIHLVEDILNELTIRQKREVFSERSSLGKKAKEHYYGNKYKFEQQISNYTQLRQLLIDYLYFIADKGMPTLYELYSIADSKEYISGLTQEDPKVITDAINRYKEGLLRVQSEEEANKLVSDLDKTFEEPYQMQLCDYFPDIPNVDNPGKRRIR